MATLPLGHAHLQHALGAQIVRLLLRRQVPLPLTDVGQRHQLLGRDGQEGGVQFGGARQRRQVANLGAQQGAAVGLRQQLAVADQHEVLTAGMLAQGMHRVDHRRHVGGVAVVRRIPDRHRPIVGGHLQIADLLLSAAAVAIADLRVVGGLFLVRVGAGHQHRGQIPAQRCGLQAKGGQCLHRQRAAHPIVHRGNLVQAAPEPIVIEVGRRNAERLLDRPTFGPGHDVIQRPRRRQTVGDQRLDHFSVGQMRHLAHGRQRVHPLLELQALQIGTDDGQRSQTLDQQLAHGHGRSSCPSTMPYGRAAQPGSLPQRHSWGLPYDPFAMCEMQA